MSTTEPITGAPVVELGDVIADLMKLPDAIYALAERTVRRYTSVAARDLAIPAPVGGEFAKIGSGTTSFLSWHDGSIWRTLGYDSGWRNLALSGPNWTAVSGHTAQYRLRDDLLQLRGGVNFAAGSITSTIAVLPAAAGADPSFRPNAQTFLQSWSSSGNAAYQATALVSTTGVISIPTGYYSGTPVAGTVFPIASSFYLN